MTDFDYIATSGKGFIQQIVSGWVRNGYYFYVQGEVPEGKDPAAVDQKLLFKYPIRMKAGRRYSRKQRGVQNVAYVRYERHWIMLATKGAHEETKEGWLDWRRSEAGNIRNCRRGEPIQLFGYSIYYVAGGYLLGREKNTPGGPPERDTKHRVRVEISRDALKDVKARLIGNARSRQPEWFAREFWNLPFEPYAPVRKQLLDVLRQVNAQRKSAGLSKLSPGIIRYRREPVKVFR